MQLIARIHYQNKNFKILHVHTSYIHALTGVCKYKNKLCIFDRQFDEAIVDIYLIPFKKRVKLYWKIKIDELKKRFLH
jgi:hypothetical protein